MPGREPAGREPPGHHRPVEHPLEHLGQRLGTFPAQHLPLVRAHGQLEGGDRRDVLHHRDAGRGGARGLHGQDVAGRAARPGDRQHVPAGHGGRAGAGARDQADVVRRRHRHAVEQPGPLQRAGVQRVPGQPLEPGEDLPVGQVPGGQPLHRAEHLQLGVQPLGGVALHGRGHLLGDGHERHRDRHLDHRERPFVGRRQEIPGQRRHEQALGQGQAGHPGVVQPLQVGPLRPAVPRQRHPGRHDQLGPGQPRGRVLELADVRPGHPPGNPGLTRDQPQLQRGGPEQILHGDHAGARHGAQANCGEPQRQGRGLWPRLLRRIAGPADTPAMPIRGPMDASKTPRFAGPPTFALLPRRDEVSSCDVAVVGVPFDTGTSYRPGARFGPAAVRQGSRLLRPWHPALQVGPLTEQQVADAGDIACNPFDITEAVGQIEAGRGRAPRRGRPSPGPRRRPHDRVPAAAGHQAAVRAGRAGPLRRAPGHLGHLLRRAGHPRHPVPPRRRGGPVPPRTAACTWASAGRCTPSRTSPTTPAWASAS